MDVWPWRSLSIEHLSTSLHPPAPESVRLEALVPTGRQADNAGMSTQLLSLLTLLIAGLALGLYTLRRRSRQGRRAPKF